MSLTSYRAAPPRVTKSLGFGPCDVSFIDASFSSFGRESKKAALCAASLWARGPFCVEKIDCFAISRPGSDLLSRVLRRSTIGAGAFHGRVRNGNGCGRPAITTRSAKGKTIEKLAEAFGLVCL